MFTKILKVMIMIKIFEVLTTLKIKKLNINNTFIKKKDLLEKPDLEHYFWSRTSTGIYRIGHHCVRFSKWLVFHDRA